MPLTPEQRRSAKKAGGITLASFGSAAIVHDLHLFEQGSFDLGALVRLDFGGGQTGVTVHDGGVSLRCDPAWTVGPFPKGKYHYLASEMPPPTVAAGPRLQAAVDRLAGLLARDAPSGTVLLIGSGDDAAAQAENVHLAPQRAAEVEKLLAKSLDRGGGDGPGRNILSGNEALSHSPSGADQPLGLARLLYGAEEVSARFVQACVLQPRPHRVELSGTGAPPQDFWRGMSGGLATALVLFTFIALALVLARRRRRRPAAPAEGASRATEGPGAPP